MHYSNALQLSSKILHVLFSPPYKHCLAGLLLTDGEFLVNLAFMVCVSYMGHYPNVKPADVRLLSHDPQP